MTRPSGSEGEKIEEWKAIVGYDGWYEISSLGRVRALPRARWVKNRYGTETFRHDKGKILAPVNNGNGYLYVSLCENGTRRNKYIHRLVAEAFCEKRAGADVVNHKDHDRTNNRAENLEWVSQLENVRYSADLMRGPRGIGKNNTTGEQYIGIKKSRGKHYFCVRKIKWIGNKERLFTSIEDAAEYRDELISATLAQRRESEEQDARG